MSLSSYELARDATQCAKSDSARPAVMSRCSLTCYPRTIARARCRAFWLVERRCGFEMDPVFVRRTCRVLFRASVATCVAERLEQELNSANTKLQNTYKLHFA
jgi:hypothetical protein